MEFNREDTGLSSVDTRVFYPRVLLDTIASPPNQNLSFNRWEGVRVQTGEHTDYGIENLLGRSWPLNDVVLWDTGLNRPESPR